jgi:hypothetical protein
MKTSLLKEAVTYGLPSLSPPKIPKLEKGHEYQKMFWVFCAYPSTWKKK